MCKEDLLWTRFVWVMNCAFVNNKLYSVTKMWNQLGLLLSVALATYSESEVCDKRDVRGKHGGDLPTEMIVFLDKLGRITNCRNLINFMELPTQFWLGTLSGTVCIGYYSHWLDLCLYLRVHNPNSPEILSYVTGLAIKCISRSALRSHEKKKKKNHHHLLIKEREVTFSD